MSKHNPSNKISMYLIKEDYSKGTKFLKDPIDTDHIDFPTGTLYYIESKVTAPKWVKSFFNESIDKFKQANSRAVFIVKIEGCKNYFAITFGQGLHLLNDSAIEEKFGLRVLLNSVEHDRLKLVTKQTLDGNHNVSTMQLPRASDIYEFNIDTETDLVKKMKGKSVGGIFSDKLINGGDSLIFTSQYNVSNIDDLVSEVYRLYRQDNYKEHFEFIDNIKLVKKNDEIEKLDQILEEKIANNEVELSFMFPGENVESVYTYKIGSKKSEISLDIDYDDYIKYLDINSKTLTLDNLKHDKVYYDVDGSNDFHFFKTMYNCCIAEFKDNKHHYCLISGKWYDIKEDFYNAVERYYDKEVEVEKEIQFIPCNWRTEDEYNEQLTIHLKDAVEMHKKTIKTEYQSSPVEVADVFFKNSYIHVKQDTSSSKLSHLFSQGFVSASLLMQRNFQEAILKEYNDETVKKSIIDFDASNNKIVYAIISNQKQEKPKIPFFSKITLKHYHYQLKNWGYKVTIRNIPRNFRK